MTDLPEDYYPILAGCAMRRLVLERALDPSRIDNKMINTAALAVDRFFRYDDDRLGKEAHIVFAHGKTRLEIGSDHYPLPAIAGSMPVTITRTRMFDDDGVIWVQRPQS